MRRHPASKANWIVVERAPGDEDMGVISFFRLKEKAQAYADTKPLAGVLPAEPFLFHASERAEGAFCRDEEMDHTPAPTHLFEELHDRG